MAPCGEAMTPLLTPPKRVAMTASALQDDDKFVQGAGGRGQGGGDSGLGLAALEGRTTTDAADETSRPIPERRGEGFVPSLSRIQ